FPTLFCLTLRRPPLSPLFPYTTLFRSDAALRSVHVLEPHRDSLDVRRELAQLLAEANPEIAALLGRQRQARGPHVERRLAGLRTTRLSLLLARQRLRHRCPTRRPRPHPHFLVRHSKL